MKKSLIGWIFLDKPIGMSSNLALQKVRNIYENCKAGYIGTLDPLASGFLPIALGKATKTIKYLENSSKEYVFTVQWGLKTTTGDFEGEIISKNKQYPRISSIKRIIKSFSGEIFQTPHRFSSKKINGVRAYKLARKKKKFELKKKSINIYKTKFLRKLSEDKTLFYVKCSGGTYIRSLAEDMAESMGTYGTLISLRRVGFGDLNKKLISLDYLLSLVHSDERINVVKPVNLVFNDANQIVLDKNEFDHILKGRSIKMRKDFMFIKENKNNDFTIAKFENNIVAIGYYANENFYPKKVLKNF